MVEHLADNIYVFREFSTNYEMLLGALINVDQNNIQVTPHHTFLTYAPDHASDPKMFEVVSEYVEDIALALLGTYGFNGVENISVPAVMYRVGQSMPDHDDMYHNASDPELRENVHVYSTVHFLNNGYSGGDLVFPNLGLVIQPESNMLVMFGCEHVHRSETITSGVKYSSTKFWRDKNAVQ
jgi:hypothetical protein